MLASTEEFDPNPPGLFVDGPPADFVPLLEEIAGDVRRESVRTLLYVMAEADERDVLPRITVPTLLIWGELDARSSLSVAHQFDRTIPDATLVVIPGAGHVCQLEQPEQLVWGEADPWIPVARGAELAQRIPGARLEQLPSAGHLVQEDQPDELTRLLREHLDRAFT